MSRKFLLAVTAFMCTTWICTAETSFLSEDDKIDDIQKRIEQEKEPQKEDAENQNKKCDTSSCVSTCGCIADTAAPIASCVGELLKELADAAGHCHYP